MLESTCEACRQRPATTRDNSIQGGRWVQTVLCTECARLRRNAAMRPLFGMAIGAALVGGLAFAAEKLMREREGNEQQPPSPAPPLTDWARRLRGATPTLAAYSRDLTAEARAG